MFEGLEAESIGDYPMYKLEDMIERVNSILAADPDNREALSYLPMFERHKAALEGQPN